MKKLVFSAIALVAFSGVSMANTGEIKNKLILQTINLEKNEVNTTEKKEDIRRDCGQVQEFVFDLYVSMGGSVWQAYYAGAAAWGNCMAAQ